MQIRNALLKDADRLAEVEGICFPEAEAASLESIRSRLAVFGECFFVMEENGEIIGFINGMVTNQRTISDIMFEDANLHDPQGQWQSVFGLDMLPQYRCQGRAALLMEAFIADARAKGRCGCILTCKEHLIHYYEKFGYHSLGVSKSVHGGAVWYDMILEF